MLSAIKTYQRIYLKKLYIHLSRSRIVFFMKFCMVDLLVSFRSRHLYHPRMKESLSINSVLPAFVPELTYDGLVISDVDMASRNYYGDLKSLRLSEPIHPSPNQGNMHLKRGVRDLRIEMNGMGMNYWNIDLCRIYSHLKFIFTKVNPDSTLFNVTEPPL